jgi:hypothetical protein
MRIARSVLALCCCAPLALLAACGSSDGGGAGGGGDGKVHPAGNGVAMSEADACDALSNAQSTQDLSLMCVATNQTCPDLLRSEFTTACLQYDQGSVQGCIAYYGMATTCDTLKSSIADCAVTPIAGSAPMGCP